MNPCRSDLGKLENKIQSTHHLHKFLYRTPRLVSLHLPTPLEKYAMKLVTSASTISCATLRALFFTIISCLVIVSASAQERNYREARVYVTAPPATNTVSPASAPVPAQLLTDRGFFALAPLDEPDEDIPTIIIDDKKTFQTILGFGGAFTDAAATTFAKLPKVAQEQFLKACFDPVQGNGYTLCRTTIHSCDYSEDMYTYDDTAGDKGLKNFSIDHDRKDRIPFIKRAQIAAKGNSSFTPPLGALPAG